MKKAIHPADSRGHVSFNWLDSHHTFSFSHYYNPERVRFGVLRVLNDDVVSESRGFDTHPHENMEIISIPLSGSLRHEDSMGNITIIEPGEVQIMSAGTGVFHSEYNHSDFEPVNFLQIWIFPDKLSIPPRYDQKKFNDDLLKNQLHTIVQPEKSNSAVQINQKAWMTMGKLDQGISQTYALHNPSNGVYVFLINGKVEIEGETLNKRDGMGVWELENLDIRVLEDAHILLIEVPMNLGTIKNQ